MISRYALLSSSPRFAIFAWTALTLWASTGCALQAATDAGDRPASLAPDSVCNPTGSSLFNTGVYLAPEGCSEITLQPLVEEPDNDSWVMEVSWPMYGDYNVLELKNLETEDTEKELLYTGDPNFVLYLGNYGLGGLKMTEGVNRIEYHEHNFRDEGDGNSEKIIIREGEFSVTITRSQ